MHKNSILILTIIYLFCATTALAASLDKAMMLNEHGLSREAKLELINVVFSKSGIPSKAKAYYELGNIAFEESKISVALNSWRKLVEKYPKSKEAKLVKNKIKELAEIVGDSSKEIISNAVAQSYLRHGDFWSKGKNRSFTIDSSWIPNVEAALKWYDKVIKEFPGSTSSKIAYQNKMRTILGWKERGRNGDAHGIKEHFGIYMPKLLKTFSAFEKEHKNASTLQAFRYQIAQAYWGNKDWEKTRKWLDTIIQHNESGSSFYVDLANRRLKKIEY